MDKLVAQIYDKMIAHLLMQIKSLFIFTGVKGDIITDNGTGAIGLVRKTSDTNYSILEVWDYNSHSEFFITIKFLKIFCDC